MLHIASHFVVPVLVALVFFWSRFRRVAMILIATMLVDLDHFVADPIYDPERCSIGFHPLHTAPAITVYALMFLIPLACCRNKDVLDLNPAARMTHLIGLGLLIHMALDWLDCLV